MKNVFVSLCLAAGVACSHNSPQADDPSAVYPQSNFEPTSEPSPVDRAATPAQTNPTSYKSPAGGNELGIVQPNTDPNAGTVAPYASAATPLAATSSSPDNTRVNKRDQNQGTLTPVDQSNKQTDLNITQAIRKAVIARDGLSFNAKNVKIITIAGKVTLRGSVNTASERSTITDIAKQTAGVANVDDQLEVKP